MLLSQSLIHQVSDSDVTPYEPYIEMTVTMSQSLIHQVSDSDSILYFERKYR